MTDILSVYDKQKDNYDSYALSLKSLLNTLIRNSGTPIHSLDSRVKNRKSLERKIIQKDKYDDILDITDIVGIRIITHYSDDVDTIAKLIESEFIIDKENSIDKRTSMEPDRFGYLSLHYIISLSENRTCLSEYIPYKNIKAEIQIRSILQHTWAEIEHDIGYKTAIGLPSDIRRYFSRLAGLLEIADDEFIKIKKAISARQEEAAKEIKEGSGESPLDIVTLNEYIKKSTLIDNICDEFKKLYNITFSESSNNTNSQKVLEILTILDIKNIKQLNDLLTKNRESIPKRLSGIQRETMDLIIKNGLSRSTIIFYLIQIVIANIKSKELEDNYFKIMDFKSSAAMTNFFEKIRNDIIKD